MKTARAFGRARANLGTGSQSLTLNDADITARTIRTVSSGNVAQSLTGSLLGSLVLSVNGIGAGPLLQPALTATLGAAAPALDLVIGPTLKVLGLRLGYADFDVDSTLCGQALLMQ